MDAALHLLPLRQRPVRLGLEACSRPVTLSDGQPHHRRQARYRFRRRWQDQRGRAQTGRRRQIWLWDQAGRASIESPHAQPFRPQRRQGRQSGLPPCQPVNRHRLHKSSSCHLRPANEPSILWTLSTIEKPDFGRSAAIDSGGQDSFFFGGEQGGPHSGLVANCYTIIDLL